MSKTFNIKEHNIWIIKKKLVEYLDNKNYIFLKVKNNIKFLSNELPCCILINDVLGLWNIKI